MTVARAQPASAAKAASTHNDRPGTARAYTTLGAVILLDAYDSVAAWAELSLAAVEAG